MFRKQKLELDSLESRRIDIWDKYSAEISDIEDVIDKQVSQIVLHKCFVQKRTDNKEFWTYIKVLDLDDGTFRMLSFPYIIKDVPPEIRIVNTDIDVYKIKDLCPITERKFRNKMQSMLDAIFKSSRYENVFEIITH